MLGAQPRPIFSHSRALPLASKLCGGVPQSMHIYSFRNDMFIICDMHIQLTVLIYRVSYKTALPQIDLFKKFIQKILKWKTVGMLSSHSPSSGVLTVLQGPLLLCQTHSV